MSRQNTACSTFTGGSYGAVVPLQVGGGQGGKRVQRQAVRAGEPFLEVQQVVRFVVLRHVWSYIQVGHILNQKQASDKLRTQMTAVCDNVVIKLMLTSSRSKRMNSRPDTSVRNSVRWSWLQTNAFLQVKDIMI